MSRIFCGIFLLASATTCMPATTLETQCVGKQLDASKFLFTLPQSVTHAMRDPSCISSWSNNDIAVASADGVVLPVLSSTFDSVTTVGCPENLSFRLSCPDSSIDKVVSCSCPPSPPTPVKSCAPKNTKVPYGFLVIGAVFIMQLLTL